MQRGYIPIEKEELPVEFVIDLAGRSFLFGFNYNESQELFTVDLYDVDEVPIVLGEMCVLNERLWIDIIEDRLPDVDIVPMDESRQSTDITYENFMSTVFLYIDDVGEVEVT